MPLGRGRADPRAGRRRAGERDVLDAGVQDERGAQAPGGQPSEVGGGVAVDVQDARAALASDAYEVGQDSRHTRCPPRAMRPPNARRSATDSSTE